MPAPYLLRLADRLARGLQRLEPERRERHRRFLLSKQTADGGFADREGGSDLYYTGFAVRGLAILGEIPADVCERLGKYLSQNSRRSLTVIDLVSWLYSSLVVQSASGIDVLSDALPDWPTRLAEILESFRTADGGYAKTHEGAAGSTYHSFLVALCYELIGQPMPEKNRLVQFIYDRQGDDGGFVEIRQMKRSGTNPTAAAVALLRMCEALDNEIRADVCEFLREVRSSEGGFQANTRIPFADGLSTFTGLLTAQDLGATDLIAPAQIQGFYGSLEQPGGGFLGAAWDQQADVEYSFYGLGGLGLLWSAEGGADT